jgi:hypothetical protein
MAARVTLELIITTVCGEGGTRQSGVARPAVRATSGEGGDKRKWVKEVTTVLYSYSYLELVLATGSVTVAVATLGIGEPHSTDIGYAHVRFPGPCLPADLAGRQQAGNRVHIQCRCLQAAVCDCV